MAALAAAALLAACGSDDHDDLEARVRGGATAARPVTHLALPNATAQALELAPGSYTLAVVPTGASSPILPSAAGVDVQLAPGDVASIAAVGCLSTTGACAGGATFQFKVLDDR